MVETAETVEWMQVGNEVEALMLEYTLIQRHKPRFNVRYMDDKSYPFLAVTTLDDWPRAMVMRGKRKKGNRYFGPYGQAYAIRDTSISCFARSRFEPAPTTSSDTTSGWVSRAAVPHREVRRPVRR